MSTVRKHFIDGFYIFAFLTLALHVPMAAWQFYSGHLSLAAWVFSWILCIIGAPIAYVCFQLRNEN